MWTIWIFYFIFNLEIFQCECQINSSNAFDQKLFISHHSSLTSSPALLRSLAEEEEIMVILMKNYVENNNNQSENVTDSEKSPLALIKQYLSYYEETTGKMSRNWTYHLNNVPYRANEVAWNVLTVFHMIKRILRSAKDIVQNLDPNNVSQYALQRQLLNAMKDTGWPQQDDFSGSMDNILRLQNIHNFNALNMSNGQINGVETNVHLWSEDCFEIGYFALQMEYYYQAVEWLEVAQLKILPDSTKKEDWPQFIQEHIKSAIAWHDSQWNASEPWDARFYTDQISKISPSLRQKRRTVELENWRGRKESYYGYINYWGLCSGENHKDNDEKSKLFCWYETEIHSVWKIKPLKAELLSIEPFIVQYYDVIDNTLMEKIKKETIPHLTRSSVLNDNVPTQSLIRTSTNTFLDDHYKEEFLSIPKTIELITGLNVVKSTSSEHVQIASYSAGGHYGTHLDAMLPSEDIPKFKPHGDRLATFIYYLSDVEQGGGTAFAQGGVASQPIKGSAVLWFNLLSSGSLDEHTWHGACPVIQGEKWISNKWILAHDQMFIPQFKCSLNKDSRLSLKVNGKHLKL